ncbi:MAG TPA: ankyrin repeat domain-containing protein [Bryobacteraceae bacterium]|jgi:ankyrin repeat protein
MKRFIPAVYCLAASLAAPALAQIQKDSLANLIESGDRKAALEKIRAGADVNAAQPDGTTPLHWAVYHVDYELLDALIAKKAKVNVTNQFGSTPLAEAVKLADARMVKTLLNAGADPEGANQDGETALMLAIKTGELPIVETLIKAGANVNTIEKFHNQTPLMWAAAAGRNAAEMVKLLLAKGADVKPRALYSDWESQITSEPRAQYRPVGGLTALLYAARDGCYECVEELADAGADVNVPTPEGVTPLMLALDNDHNDVAKLLLARGASPNVWDWWGRTALYIAIDRKEGGSSGGLRLGGAAGGGRASRGRAAPVAAGGRPPVSDMEIVNALLAAGIDPNTQLNMHRPSRGGNSGRFIENLRSTGATPLSRASEAGDAEVAGVLLANGADPNINDMGLTPFLIAAGVGPGNRGGTGLAAQGAAGGAANKALMDLLLQHGANVNAQVTGTQTYSMRVSRAPSSNEGMTALHVAAQAGRIDMVRYLLDKGINPELVDAEGRKAIDLVGAGGRGSGAAAPAAAGNPGAAGNAQAAGTPPAAGGRGAAATAPPAAAGRGPATASPATLAEIRTLLQGAASKK